MEGKKSVDLAYTWPTRNRSGHIGLALDSIQLSDTFHLTYEYRLFCRRCQVLSFVSLTGLLVSFVNLYKCFCSK